MDNRRSGRNTMNANKPDLVFLVEDDEKLSELIKSYLERHHFAVAVEHDGSRAVQRILDETPVLVILDIMLPGKDGKTICRELRGLFNGPIIMLTALDEEVDQIVGLELGADDYITKPVKPRLLLSRINAMLRMAARSGTGDSKGIAAAGTEIRPEIIVLGSIEIRPASRDVFLEGTPLELTSYQFDLLSFLAVHAGQIISRDQLSQHLRGIDYDGFSRSIDLAIVRLREKIGDDGRRPRMIKSIRGEGYLMVKQ
jgi:two-component system response regulator RstA